MELQTDNRYTDANTHTHMCRVYRMSSDAFAYRKQKETDEETDRQATRLDKQTKRQIKRERERKRERE